MEYSSDQTSSLAEYATRKWELAKKVIGVVATEQHLVEAVISGMSDFRIRSDLLRLTPKNLPQLIQSLNSYKRKKPLKDSDHQVPSKKPKLSLTDNNNKRRCHKCHKIGHLQKDCFLNNRDPIKKDCPSTSTIPKDKPTPVVSCTFCNKKGHTFENCFSRQNKKAKDDKSVTINSLIINKNTSNFITIDGRDFLFLLDSGAECSLMRDSVGDSIKGKIIYDITLLRGVGDNSFYSSRKKICTI